MRNYTLIEGLPKAGYAVATFKDTNEQLIIPDSLLVDIKCLFDKKGYMQISPNNQKHQNNSSSSKG